MKFFIYCVPHIPIFGKNLVLAIYLKMLLASQIAAGFLNKLFLRNKLMKQPHFWHVDTNSQNV